MQKQFCKTGNDYKSNMLQFQRGHDQDIYAGSIIQMNTNVKHIDGVPQVINDTPNYISWQPDRYHDNSNDYLHDVYSYDKLEKIYPWAQTYRCGLIIIARDTRKVLFVVQKAQRYYSNNNPKIKTLPARFGFPKGIRAENDITALETALRKSRTEIGVDILDPIYGPQMRDIAFVIPRNLWGILEILVYFVVVVETTPPIIIDYSELSGYAWVDIEGGLNVGRVTNPTSKLLNVLRNYIKILCDDEE